MSVCLKTVSNAIVHYALFTASNAIPHYALNKGAAALPSPHFPLPCIILMLFPLYLYFIFALRLSARAL
jgi:hypothetical protein